MEILSGLLTPLIALIVAYIAWQQLKTNRDKVRLALYEKRFAVYLGLKNLLVKIPQVGGVGIKEIIEYNVSTGEAEFLFGRDVLDYLLLIRKKAAHLMTTTKQLASNDLPLGEERSKIAKEQEDLSNWFTDQFDEAIKIFSPYLRFAHKG
jgi:hypothetical protein